MMLFNRIKAKAFHYTWDLAYGKYEESIVFRGIKEEEVRIVHNPYKHKWFADPFIYDEDDLFLQLFVEEFDKAIKRGRIAHITIDKQTDTIVKCSVILDLPTHLSFPVIYRIGDRVYVHPENSSSGRSFIYEYDNELDLLVNPVLVVDRPLTDAVIRRTDSGFEISATTEEDSNGRVLLKFESTSFWGPYAEKESVVFPWKTARMAGCFIDTNDAIIRPAQNCIGDYGRAVWFYKNESVVGQLLPWGKYDGLHTFNTNGNSFVIDLKKYDNVVMYRIKDALKRIVNC